MDTAAPVIGLIESKPQWVNSPSDPRECTYGVRICAHLRLKKQHAGASNGTLTAILHCELIIVNWDLPPPAATIASPLP